VSYVPNAPIREAFERSEVSAYELAERLGYWRTDRGVRRPCASSVQKALGIRERSAKNGKRAKLPTKMRYETAVRFARELGLDPIDVGI
jgi:hypothetical protein